MHILSICIIVGSLAIAQGKNWIL